ncbi:MAG: sulfatase family protein [bacterium JZ-2024 1]
MRSGYKLGIFALCTGMLFLTGGLDLKVVQGEPGKPGAKRKPNILFILTDDQRWDTLGVYGNRSIKTQNLDGLAREGALFLNGFVAAPLCCPSRATFLTGLYPHQTGIVSNEKGRTTIPEGVKTVADYLNEAGYITGFVGKAHLDGGPYRWGFREAPVYLPGGGSRHQNPMLIVEGNQRALPGKIHQNEYAEEEYQSNPGEPQKVEGLITPIFVDAAIRFLERHRKDEKPFFLWVATTAPHTPYYNDPKFPYLRVLIQPPLGFPDPVLSSEDWEGYYSTISHLDDHLGRLFHKVKELGLEENTVIIFSSDNGYMMGSHQRKGKSIWYEESVRVPWIIKWKGKIPAGSIISTPVSSVDFLPTVLEIADIPVPLEYEGKSILHALGITPGPVREVVYSEVRGGGGIKQKPGRRGYNTPLLWQMVRTEEFKYVWLSNGEEILYDLRKDPKEMRNVAGEEEYSGVMGQMRALHQEWLQRTPVHPFAQFNLGNL